MKDKTLIIYFSKGGATEFYADIIAETLRKHGYDIDLVHNHPIPSSDF